MFDDIVVSSDGAEILDVARRNGVTAVDRPARLAVDDSPTAATVSHIISTCGFDATDVLVLLQPTSPMRTAAHVCDALNAYRKAGQPLVSMDESPQYPDKFLTLDAEGSLAAVRPGASTLPRQALCAAFKPNGALYIFSVQEFLAVGDVPIIGGVPYMMDKLASIDIDDESDLRLATLILENPHVFYRRS